MSGETEAKEAVRWRGRLARYFRGEVVRFPYQVEEGGWSRFARGVYRVVFDIPYGQVVSYGEVAIRAGCAGAGRAVGRALAANPLAIVIPCHRVVKKGGAPGGFSGAGGVAAKKWLLAWEKRQRQRERGGRDDRQGIA